MSLPKEPMPAKLVVSVFLQEKTLIEGVSEALARRMGDIDIVSPWMPFDKTSYYEPEMGAPLFRRMLIFKPLIEQERLAEIKGFTNSLEQQYLLENRRRVNIDPGYMLLERFVLATGKNFSHRIYIGHGIYADLTLIYRKGKFQVLPWTFPDYADAGMHHFLTKVREKYAFDLKHTLGKKTGDRRQEAEDSPAAI